MSGHTATTFSVTSEPATEPLTLDQLKDRLRILSCDFDTELTDLLKAGRKVVEDDSYRKLITQTVAMYLDDFPGSYGDISIRLAPISSITHVKYYDQEDTQQTVSSSTYYTDLTTTPPRIVLKESQQWPVVNLYRPNPVTVTFVAGYGAASAVPQIAKLAIAEWVRATWEGCEGRTDTYKRLVSSLQWTAYHKVM
jgi:uncharacterized phiE125 gp8 family phage protein